MKANVCLLLILCITGCTSMQPVEMEPEQLRQKIVAGELLKAGDKARIFTTDEAQHEFRVRSVTDEMVIGDEDRIPVDEIVAVETREFSGGRTLLLGAGSVSILYIIAILVASVAALPPA